jgi:aspartyl-tRNA(Asn)/glutamyl-tRNA(Gln) amidotransferase subunit A
VSEPDELAGASVTELAARMGSGDLSAADVTRAHLDCIEATDGRVGAFLSTLDEQAMAHAHAVDRRRASGEAVGELAGVPVAVKDIFATRGIETTCGSRILAGYRPPYDAAVVEALREADAVLLGKTNMDEFAMGSSTENSAFRPTRNPWDLDRVPGGSSGGSAAAVAAGQASLAIGTDTGGSIRQPAALCGVVGVKPTYGLASRYGLIAFASSLDQAGPIARNVTDAAAGFSAITGHDPRDSTSVPDKPPDVHAPLDDGVQGLRIGVVSEFMGEGMTDGVRSRVEAAIERLSRLGADVVDASLPHTSYGISAYYLIAPSEASSNLSRYDGVRQGLRVDGDTAEEMMAATRDAGFGAEVKRRVMIGTYALSAGYYEAYYDQAQRVRTLILRDFAAAYADCDVLVGPTSPRTAFGLGELVDDPLTMYLNDVYTVPASLAGLPAMSLPCGVDETGLPVGFQVMAPVLSEPMMFRVARALENDLGFEPRPAGPGTLAHDGAGP